MLENNVRGLGNVSKFGSGAWKCEKIGFEGLELSESGVWGLGKVRKWGSRACKCEKLCFGGLGNV